MMTINSKIKEICHLDLEAINLDSLLSKKRREVSFLKRGIIDKFVSKIRYAGFRYGVLSLVFLKALRFLKIDFAHKPVKLNQFKVLQKSFILPGALTHEPIDDVSILVVAHIYYIEELDRIFTYLCNIPGKYHLCITTDQVDKKLKITERLGISGFMDYEIAICQNRGRDIAPMFIEFQEKFDRYDYLLHIHSKKSPHDSELAGWSEYLYQNLLGSREIVLDILTIFKQHPHIGMIAPEHYGPLINGDHMGWGGNYKACSALLDKMGIDIHPHSKINFPSGSMFWAKTKALKPIALLGLRYEDFPEERRQLDATLAHAIERILFYACELAGYAWLQTVTPTVHDSKSTKIDIASLAKRGCELTLQNQESIKT